MREDAATGHEGLGARKPTAWRVLAEKCDESREIGNAVGSSEGIALHSPSAGFSADTAFNYIN